MSFNFYNDIYYQMETKKDQSYWGIHVYIYQTMYTISHEDFIPTELFHAFALHPY